MVFGTTTKDNIIVVIMGPQKQPQFEKNNVLAEYGLTVKMEFKEFLDFMPSRQPSH